MEMLMSTKYFRSQMLSAIALLGLIILQAGCSSGPDMKDVYDSNIKRLHVCYTMFMEDHGYNGPKDEAEFKDYLKNNPTAIYMMKRIDLTPENVDEIFVSDRDNEPFIVKYGLTGVADHAIIFEKTGLDNKRYVAFSDPLELDSDEYEAYLSGKKKAEIFDAAEEAATGQD